MTPLKIVASPTAPVPVPPKNASEVVPTPTPAVYPIPALVIEPNVRIAPVALVEPTET